MFLKVNLSHLRLFPALDIIQDEKSYVLLKEIAFSVFNRMRRFTPFPETTHPRYLQRGHHSYSHRVNMLLYEPSHVLLPIVATSSSQQQPFLADEHVAHICYMFSGYYTILTK